MGLSDYRMRAWARQDSNLQSLAYQTSAMAITLRAQDARTRIRTWIERLEAAHSFLLNHAGMGQARGDSNPYCHFRRVAACPVSDGPMLAPPTGIEPAAGPRQDPMLPLHHRGVPFVMAAVGVEPTRAGFGGQLPTSWRCGLSVRDDGDRNCTGLGSLCGGAHISSATPSLSGDGGDRTPLLQVHGLPCFLLHHVSRSEGANGTCTHLLRLTKTMPRCLGLGTMKPGGRFELPWVRLQGGRSA